jgi:hypothetical protein
MFTPVKSALSEDSVVSRHVMQAICKVESSSSILTLFEEGKMIDDHNKYI